MAAHPTHLHEIVRHKSTHMGFCDASDLGEGGMWLDLVRSGHNLVWSHPWPLEIIEYLVSSKNLEGKITISDLKLAAIVLHEATLL